MQRTFGAKTEIGKRDGQIQAMLFVLLVGANLGATNPKNRPPMVDKPLQSNTGSHSASPGRAADSTTTFKYDILPIFRASCVRCHAGQNAGVRLQLDSEAGVLRAGANGKAVVAGDSANSLLMRRIIGQGDDPRMPYGGPALGRLEFAPGLSAAPPAREADAERSSAPQGNGISVATTTQRFAPRHPPELAAWTMVSNVLLSLDEAQTKQ